MAFGCEIFGFFLGRLIKYIPRMGQFCKIFVGYLGEGLAKGKQLDLWNFFKSLDW